eukprot:gene2073-2948_t
MRILVVEDEQKTADYLQQGLTESGYVVDCAASGIDGLHLARQNTYELVILDVNLPNTDGWEVLEQLRRDGNQRVMMLTARGRLADKIKGLDMGADDYLGKPFNPRELLARIHAVLRRRPAQVGRAFLHCADHFAAQVLFEVDLDGLVRPGEHAQVFGQELHDGRNIRVHPHVAAHAVGIF